MKQIHLVLAGAALATMLAVAPAREAKADGGAVAIGVGAYLVLDFIVGEKCHMRKWPFNIIKKVGYGLHGKRVCKYGKKY